MQFGWYFIVTNDSFKYYKFVSHFLFSIWNRNQIEYGTDSTIAKAEKREKNEHDASLVTLHFYRFVGFATAV